MIVDTHAHLTDESLSPGIQAFLAKARAAGVTAVLSVGTTLATSQQCVALAEQHPEIRAAVGLHPNDCCRAAESDWPAIQQLAQHPRVAALGETGLDKHWDDCPWDIQVEYFVKHLELGSSMSLPVVIHTRDCAEETLAVLQSQTQRGPIRGVMHSYTGSLEVARGCLDLGLYISFAGMVTFKNADEIRAVARLIPSDRILVETDSPYLTPHPHRGKRPNHPALVRHTLEHLAQLRGYNVEEFARITTDNAEALFGRW
ncbi:MAG: TatD family hydrolase [Planctomycetales bacterium]|nr:TatD family hydrolase [Planctomycetales bacterium]